MNGILVRVSLASALLLAALFMLSCGASSNRVLESISVSPQAGNGQVQFVAMGTFSAPPVNVTPLPVNWCVQNPKSASPALCAPSSTPPVITSQGLATCGTLTFSVSVFAEAPADPKLPLNAQGPGVIGTATLVCP